MSHLSHIKSYVNKMAEVLSVVLEMDVLICDSDLRYLGYYEYQGLISTDTDYLKEDSVVAKAMREKQIIIHDNAKKENASCKKCCWRSICRTETIIAYPIIKDNMLLGGIGVYSQEKKQKEKLIRDRASLVEFVGLIKDLIVIYMENTKNSLEMAKATQRMNDIIEAFDFALASVDENECILYTNQNFQNLFSAEYEIKGNNIRKLLSGIKTCREHSQISNIQIKTQSGMEAYEVTYSPTFVGGNYTGALIYLRKGSEVLARANEIISLDEVGGFHKIIGTSPSFIKVKEEAELFAASNSNILIQGESGTGKEIFARAIHSKSKYGGGPFVAVNCAAIPDSLLESELFGYVGGAFTGASKNGRAGKFEIANKGTLFLDEIGELPIHLQPKLLRVLQEKKIQRVGSNLSVDVDLRIITATNRNLQHMMETGEFREDLFYRLSVIPIVIPPLREREEDINVLVYHFLNYYTNMLDKKYIQSIDSQTMKRLIEYSWPGNVRELQNVIEYAVNKCKNKTITIKDMPDRIIVEKNNKVYPKKLKEVEKQQIIDALNYFKSFSDTKASVAKALGISRSTLYRKMTEYGLNE